MQSNSSRRVLISGAGIAGPTLAWFLAKAGAQVTLVEKSPALLSQGQNIDIQDSARTVIDKMGLLGELRRFNTTEKGMQFIDPKGRPIAPFPVNAAAGSAGSPTSEFEILRGDLAVVLYQATKNLPNVTYRFGTHVQDVISNDDACVKVVFNSGETQSFDLLVAADGQWSRVRKQCFAPAQISVLDTNMYATYWTVPRLPGDNDWWNVYLGLHAKVIHLRPDPHGTARTMFTLMPRNAAQKQIWQEASRADRKTQEALVRAEFADSGWQAHRFLDAMPNAADFYFQAIQQIRMTQWSKARVVCLGDAAYAPTPLTGMGTSLAILGAYVLAGELSRLRDDEPPAAALAAYESAFRPFVQSTQKLPPFVPAIAHPTTAPRRWLLQSAARAMSKVVALPGWSKFYQAKPEKFPLPSFDAV